MRTASTPAARRGTPICQLPNVEHNEQNFPLLVLYRKELPDSGGAGRYRGGLSAETCFIPHNTDRITQDTLSSGNATPTSTGMMGGFPSTTNAYQFIRESDILERMAERRLIDDHSQVSGRPEHLELRQENFDQHPADVYAVRWSGGGGFGDPMRRDPAKIQHDLLHQNVTPVAARAIFGAVLERGRRDGGRRGHGAKSRRHQGRPRCPAHQRGCAPARAQRRTPLARDRFAGRARGCGRRLLGLR